MINLIKMDFQRLIKSKYFTASLFASLILSFTIIAIIVGLVSLVQLMGEQAADMIVLIAPFVAWTKSISIFEIIMFSLNALSVLMVAVVASLFVSEEQQSGYIKNIAGQVKDKSMLVISKFVVLAFVTLFVLLAYAVGSSLAGYIFVADAINYEGVVEFLVAISVKFLLYVAIVSIVMLLCTITKSKSLSIAIGVLFGTHITYMAYTTLSTILRFLFGREIDMASIMPDGLVSKITMSAEPGLLIRGIVVSVVCITVFTFISCVVMKKRDTR